MANEVKAPSGDWLSFAKGAGITLVHPPFFLSLLPLWVLCIVISHVSILS
jgi:hypothetical protein